MAPPASTKALAYPTKFGKEKKKKENLKNKKRTIKKKLIQHPFLPLLPLILLNFISDVQSWDKLHFTTLNFFSNYSDHQAVGVPSLLQAP